MIPLYDILHSLEASRARAEKIANELEEADPQAAAVFRKFAEELWDVWTRNYPLMPSNKEIFTAVNGKNQS